MANKRQATSAIVGTSFAAVADETAKKRKEAQQKVNKAIAQANRRRHRADQKTGALVMGIPDEIRGRVLEVVDKIVDDEQKLDACEWLFQTLEGGASIEGIMRATKLPFVAEAAE